MRRCIVYHVCCRSHYMRMAIKSARSAKRLMPDVETLLITDLRAQKAPCFDVMIREEPVDLVNAHLAPLWLLPEGYDSGLYTGADSYFCRPVYDVFELVEAPGTDVALVHTSGKPRETKYPSPGVPEAWPHWGDALLCFKVHAQTRKFFTDYRETFLKHVKEHRQAALWEGPCHPSEPPFRIALYHSGLRITTLPQRYCTPLGDLFVRGDIKMITTPKIPRPEALGEEANRHAPYLRYFKDGKTVQYWKE